MWGLFVDTCVTIHSLVTVEVYWNLHACVPVYVCAAVILGHHLGGPHG